MWDGSTSSHRDRSACGFAESERETARLLDQFEARLRIVALENAKIYREGNDRLLGDVQRLIEALSAERAARRADVRDARALVAELRALLTTPRRRG